MFPPVSQTSAQAPTFVENDESVEPEARLAIRTAIRDDGRAIRGLREQLSHAWMCTFPEGTAPPELGIHIIRYLEPLTRVQHWLSGGVPHLIIRFTDDEVRVGPLVAERGAPCHSCEALHLVDANPALPVLAARAYGRLPLSETDEVGIVAGAAAAVFVQHWRSGSQHVHTQQLAIPVSDGIVSGLPTLHEVAPHPDCACSINAESRPLRQTARVLEHRAQRSKTRRVRVRRGRE